MATNSNASQPPPQRMTQADKKDLMSIVRQAAKVEKSAIEAVQAERMADFEEQLAAKYKANNRHWKTITAEAERVVQEADAAIASKCRELGIPAEFRPGLTLGWYERGENAERARQTELRRVARSRTEANAAKAKVQIERQELALLADVTSRALETTEGREWLARLPTAQALMPRLVLAEIESAERSKRREHRRRLESRYEDSLASLKERLGDVDVLEDEEEDEDEEPVVTSEPTESPPEQPRRRRLIRPKPSDQEE